MKKITLAAGLATAAALALAACGSSSSSSTTASTTASSTTSGGTASSGGGASSGGSSTVKVSADPSGNLAFQQSKLTAKAGQVTVDFTNDSPVAHNVTIESGEDDIGNTDTITGDSTSTTVNLKPGTYTFYCSVDGHEAAGMKGTLTVN